MVALILYFFVENEGDVKAHTWLMQKHGLHIRAGHTLGQSYILNKSLNEGCLNDRFFGVDFEKKIR